MIGSFERLDIRISFGKFAQRFGLEAMKFVNGTVGRQLNLRGINAKVVQPGTIRVGDAVTKT